MWLATPCLALVTSLDVCGDVETLVERVARAVDGGVGLVQVREKHLPAGALLALAERLREVTRPRRTLLFVNDRVDIALACGADGVQLGEESLPVVAARRVAGARLRIGRSVHSVAGAVEAERAGADLLVVGTVFPSASHAGEPAYGPELLAEVRRRVALPVLGIGGVTAANAAQVMEAGADGAAVITSVLAAPDPARAACDLLAAMRARSPRALEAR